MVQIKRIIIFRKGPRKKLKIKTIRAKLKKIIQSIWIKGWNWKPIKLYKWAKVKKIRNPKNKDQIEEDNIS
jgi:hypothetical protein